MSYVAGSLPIVRLHNLFQLPSPNKTELKEILKKHKSLEVYSPLKKAIDRAKDILAGTPVEGTKMNNELEGVIEMQANKTHGKLREALLHLRDSAHNYLGIYNQSLEE